MSPRQKSTGSNRAKLFQKFTKFSKCFSQSSTKATNRMLCKLRHALLVEIGQDLLFGQRIRFVKSLYVYLGFIKNYIRPYTSIKAVLLQIIVCVILFLNYQIRTGIDTASYISLVIKTDVFSFTKQHLQSSLQARIRLGESFFESLEKNYSVIR